MVAMDTMFVCGLGDRIIEALPPNQSTGSWTSYNGAVVIDPGAPRTMVTDLDEGMNMFVWSLSSGSCQSYSSDSLYIYVHKIDELVANPDTYEINLNDSLTQVNLLNNDVFDATTNDLEITIIEYPEYGRLLMEDHGAFRFLPHENYFGQDSMIYELCYMSCPSECDTAMVVFNVSGVSESGECLIPNIITPNGDGANDNFTVSCIDEFPEAQLMIFNRHGDKVFETHAYKNDWSGTYEGKPLPPGTYFYLLHLNPDDGLKPLQGYFTIFR